MSTVTKNKARSTKTKKEKGVECKRYSSCQRPEKTQGRCSFRKCSAFKK